MHPKPLAERVALSPREFAVLFGKEQTWGYRQIYSGKVKTISEYGRILIPAAEVERILGEAGTYNGMKAKVPKRDLRLKGWQQFIADRRKATKAGAASKPAQPLKKLRPAGASARAEAIARLGRGRSIGR